MRGLKVIAVVKFLTDFYTDYLYKSVAWGDFDSYMLKIKMTV